MNIVFEVTYYADEVYINKTGGRSSPEDLPPSKNSN